MTLREELTAIGGAALFVAFIYAINWITTPQFWAIWR